MIYLREHGPCPIWRNSCITWQILVENVPLSSRKWNKSGNNETDQAPPFTPGHSRGQGHSVIWGAVADSAICNRRVPTDVGKNNLHHPTPKIHGQRLLPQENLIQKIVRKEMARQIPQVKRAPRHGSKHRMEWSRSTDRTRRWRRRHRSTSAVKMEGEARRKGEEGDTLDWAAVVTAHAEDRAEDMDLSTENLSEMEGSGGQGKTQETVPSRKTSVIDESSADECGKGENPSPSRRQAEKDDQSRTDNAKNRASLSK